MSLRPPPLRASDNPPTYRIVTRVYRNSLRPVVIVLGCVVAIWALIWAIPSFQDINDDREHGQPKFAIFDIVFGSVYTFACVCAVFGVIAATMQRLPLIRIYAWLSTVISVVVVGAAFMRVIIHFVHKDGLLRECEAVAQGEGVEFRFGIWGPRVRDNLSPEEARIFCDRAWNRDSLNEILFLIFEIIFSIFFTMVSFAYYHQVRDPTSPANLSRTPVTVAPVYPDHYNRPYDAGPGYAPQYAPYPPYNAGPQPLQANFAPPPGPPPTDMGYGVGVGATKDREMRDDDSEVTKFEDPFADFDGPSKPKQPGTPPAH
ncbi:hypothetical protein C8Q76DRAFT_750854 [Earliella scabrosa]|nr:hypothetical protein C8Q76DRAFT_750854 [Earliella scabrosa]